MNRTRGTVYYSELMKNGAVITDLDFDIQVAYFEHEEWDCLQAMFNIMAGATPACLNCWPNWHPKGKK